MFSGEQTTTPFSTIPTTTFTSPSTSTVSECAKELYETTPENYEVSASSNSEDALAAMSGSNDAWMPSATDLDDDEVEFRFEITNPHLFISSLIFEVSNADTVNFKFQLRNRGDTEYDVQQNVSGF